MMLRQKTLFLAGALAVAGCYTSDELTAPDDLPATSRCYPLAMRNDLPWSGTNDATLTTWLDSHGCASASYDPAEILDMYIDNVTSTGMVAFAGHNYRRMEPTYAWTAQLMAGHTHAQIEQLTLDAAQPQLDAKIDTTQVVGSRTVNGWLRIYGQ